MNIAKYALPLVVASILSSPALAAKTTLEVKLWDKGGNIDMSKGMGLGIGMGGDMKTAPMGVDIDKKSVKAGKVIINVLNSSKTMVHELIVSPIKDANETLPYLNNESRVDEEHGSHLGEVSELEPGQSGSLTITLKPGLYALYCNIPNHYMGGMWTLLTVTK